MENLPEGSEEISKPQIPDVQDNKKDTLLQKLKSHLNSFRESELFFALGFLVLLFLIFKAGNSFQKVMMFSKYGGSFSLLPNYFKDFLLLITTAGLSFVIILHYIRIPFLSELIEKLSNRIHPLVGTKINKVKENVNSWNENFKVATPKNRLTMLRGPVVILVIYYIISVWGKSFLPPKVAVTFPGKDGVGIPVDSQIEIQFDKAVNKVSVEKSFSIVPSVAGKFEWSGDSSVTFIPEKPFGISNSYTVKLGSAILSSVFVPKITSDEFKFDTVGNPVIVLASPQTEAPDANTPITVMFDRPMVPLTTIAEKEKFDPAFSITPEIRGEGRWLGTSAYQFKPTEILKPATTYTYRVKAGLKSKDGGELKEDATYSFSTERPRILSTSPVDNYEYANPSASISATLNLKPEITSSQKAFHVYKLDGDNKEEIAGVIKIYKNQVGFYPSKPLVREAKYEVKIESGLKSTDGENDMNSSYSWKFKVGPVPKITGTDPANNAKDEDETYQLIVKFASPMDEKSFKGNVMISPAPDRKPSLYFSSYSGNNQLNIGTYLARSTNYTITIKAGVKDQYGVALGSDYSFSFTTAPYKPSISIQPTNTYFASFNQDVAPRIVAKVVNSSSVNYKLYKLKREDFLDLYKRVYINNGSDRNLQSYNPEQLEKVREWSETFEANQNVPVNVITKVEKGAEEKIASGLYFLDARIDSGAHDNLVMVVTKTALTLKTSSNQALVWAVDQTNGDVIADMEVDLVRIGGNSIKSGKTNSDGVFKTDVEIRSDRNNYNDYQNPLFAFTRKGGDEGVVIDNWGKGISNYEFGLQYYYDNQESDDYRANKNLKIHMLLDRPIYRPGQTVYFKGIVREDNDGQYKLLDGNEDVEVKVYEAQNKEVFSQNLKLNSYGSFNGSFDLSSAGSVGGYRIEAKIAGNGFNQSFQVEEYKKPDYAVTVIPEKTDYVDGSVVKIGVDSSFYFGSPVDHAPITWTLTTEDSPYRWTKDAHFEFGDSDSYWYRPWWSYNEFSYFSGNKVTEGKGETDGEGHFDIQLPINISQKNVNQIMRLEAVVKDANSNQVIANSKEFVVHQANVQVGIKPEDYSGRSNQESKVDIVTVGINGQELANVPVKVSFYKRTWDYIKEEDSDTGDFYWTNKPKDSFVTEVSTVTGEFGRVVASFTPTEGGMFRAVAEAKDEKGRTTKSAIYVWVSGSGINVPRENHDRIVMVTDKDEYAIGETAKVVSVVPYDETTGLITVERGSVFDYKVVKTSADNQSAEMQIKDNYSPNAFISGIFVKKGTGVKDPPQMKMGVVEVRVKNPKKQLKVELKTNKEKYSPAEEVKIEVSTKDGNGIPVAAEIAVTLVDEAVWSLARVSLADIYQTFYRPINLQVITANDLTVSMDRLNANINLGSKGGSGGGGGGDGLETLREKFLDTAYWNANVETNSNGVASLTVKLPDNLTTWRLIGVAASKETAVGDVTRKVLVTKDVLIQPLMPRFLSIGDKPMLGLVVHNTTSSDSNIHTSIETKGIRVLEGSEKDVAVPAGSSKKIYWRAEAEDAKEGSVIMKVQGGGSLGDSVKLTLPIVSYFTPEVVATSGEAKDLAEEKIMIPNNVVPNQGKLDITLSPTLGSGVTDAASFLLDYPYGCNEQTINKVIPATALLDLAKEAGLQNIGGYNKDQLDAIVKEGIQRLVNSQRIDGGWGWWVNDESHPALTAMIADGLFYTKSLGFTVDDTIIKRASNYLHQIISKGDQDLERQAYIASVMAKVDKVDPGLLSYLMERRWQLTPIGRAYLLRALQEGNGLRQDQFRLMDELTSLAKKSNTTTHWEIPDREWSFVGRNYAFTALMLEALTKRNSKDSLIPETTRWLMQARRDGYWETTTETSAVVRSIVYMIKNRKEANPNLNWKILLSGKSVKEGKFAQGDLLKQIGNEIQIKDIIKGQEVPVGITKSGSGSLYYNMNLKYYLPFTAVEPVEQGIVIAREFVNRNGKVIPNEKLTAGQELWVRLTILAPTMINNVIVEDKLPAGIEAVNESLATTAIQNVEKLKPTDDSDKSLWYFNHSEIRDDRVVLFANYLPQGVYEYTYRVRPTTPGVYHHAPAQIYNMYIPDISGHSAGGWMEVSE